MTDWYSPVDAEGRSYVADLGGIELKFTRALSARQELALVKRSESDPAEALDVLIATIAAMAPDQDEVVAAIADRFSSVEIWRLIGNATKALRVNPTGEPSGSSPQAETGGDTGVAAPV